MRIVFPFNPLEEKEADGPFHEEFLRLKALGVECSLFDYDSINFDEFRPKPSVNDDDTVLYRGWMMNPDLYKKFENLVKSRGGKLLTSLEDYIGSHHLPNWYESCKDFTSESYFFENDDALEKNAMELGWESFFVKDFVKSNYNERGSIAHSPSEVVEIVNLIEEHRGEIEGGISLRKVEEYLPETEKRYFVLNGTVYSPDGEIPGIVLDISKAYRAPFYSVDLIQRSDMVFRLVELGDGQVSDRKLWDADVFCKMVAENA
jgi:hypothetical protein